MSESEIQKQIIDTLRAAGCKVIRLNAGKARMNVRLAEPGTPDLLALGKNGNHLWIEVKDEKGKLRDTQVEMHEWMRENGHLVIVARSVEDIPLSALVV